MNKAIKKCRLCGESHLTTLMSLGDVCHAGMFNLNGKVPSAPLEIVQCIAKDGCGLVQLKHEFDPDMMYGEHYGYRSGLNASMVAHLRSIAETAIEYYRANDNKRAPTILDIGSNDGTLLGHFKDIYPDGPLLIGIDPSSEKFARYYRDEIIRSREFFSKSEYLKLSSSKKADIITSIAMFYDLPDPQSTVHQIAEILDEQGVWIVEQSYLPSMLGSNSFDTICHEHTEYYCLAQFDWMCNSAGLEIENMQLNSSNGGSFCLYIRKKNQQKNRPSNVDQFRYMERLLGSSWGQQFVEFKSRIMLQKKNLINELKQFQSEGIRICGLGASTKGNILLQHYGLDSDCIEAIAEVNPDKFGMRTPGTGIPIISQEEALRQFDHFLVLPWHFKDNFIRNDAFGGKKLIFPLPEVSVRQL